MKNGQFDQFHVLDFVNPAGIAALENPDLRFAAFSDSIVVSADEHLAERFVATLGSLFRSWFSDFVFVRGGVALGEIEWVDGTDDVDFRALRNFQYARVFGRALAEAVDVEKSSGPGAVCFLSEGAASSLRTVRESFVVAGLVPMLAWADAQTADQFRRAVAEARGFAERHRKATEAHFERVVKGR